MAFNRNFHRHYQTTLESALELIRREVPATTWLVIEALVVLNRDLSDRIEKLEELARREGVTL